MKRTGGLNAIVHLVERIDDNHMLHELAITTRFLDEPFSVTACTSLQAVLPKMSCLPSSV
jgi:hypothetical protein